MMKKRLILCTVLINSFLYLAIAVDRKAGIDFYKFGELEPAKSILLSHFRNSSGTDKATISYYLGEIYLAEQRRDSADFYFKTGSVADPNYVQNEIGLAKLQLKSNAALGDASLKKIADKNKKKPDVLITIARAYFENGDKAKAQETLEVARKANNRYADIYVLEGDIFASEKDYNKASSAYGQALVLDKQNKEAYVRYANVYKSVNPKLAVDILEQLVALDPSFPLSQKAVAEAYYSSGQVGKAAAAYAKYAASEYSSPSDLSVYATILYYSGNYEKSAEIAAEAVKKNPNDYVMNRLLMYNNFEQKKYPEGLAVGDKFMKMKGSDKQEFIWLDYMYYGRLLQKDKQWDAAIVQFEKARNLDASKATVYKELGEVYDAKGDYDNAIANYKIYIKEGGDAVNVNDYFALGRYNYLAGAAIKEKDKDAVEKQKSYLLAADTLFSQVAEKAPNSYLGNFWRARTNSALDPKTEQGLAKPYYEAALTLLDPANSKDTKSVIEIYRYMGGYYFLVKNDKATSRSYWNKILELDPSDTQAKEALKKI